MDIPATQVCEDRDVSTQKIALLSRQNAQKQQVGILHIGSNSYPVKEGINKIGRHPDSDIIINDQTVSKKHAEIEANSHEATWVCDLHSSNSTKLNNSTLRPGRLYELKDGNVLEFGMARAVYKLYRSPDDSVISETPAPNRTKAHMSIPETPDSSMSNSSGMENVSAIPATQNDDEEKHLFRYPSRPLRLSASSNRKSEVQDSSIDDLDTSGSFVTKKKESVSEQNVSIHDMETQNNSYETDNHNVETQKIRVSIINAAAKPLCEQFPDDISDAEKQKERNTNSSITDIHDIETQHEDDKLAKLKIYDMETQRIVNVHDMETPKKVRDRSIRSDTETSGINDESSTSTEKDTIHDRVTQKFEIKRNISCCSEDKNENDEIKENSQILITRFGNELPDLDESRNLIGSQNMLEEYFDESNDGVAEPSTAGTGSHVDANEKSTDDDNIFDAMTQVTEFDRNALKVVTRQVDYSCKASLIAGDSDTEEGGVFQSYLYNKSQDDVIHITSTTNPPKSQESDDSTTDEEGQFAELAMRIKTSASNSFESKCNRSRKTTGDNNSSKDSEDFFDKPTQSFTVTNSTNLCHQEKVDTGNEVFDAPTQTIAEVVCDEVKINESAKTEIDDTQQMKNTSVTAKRNFDEEDVTEMEDNSPTQILSVPEKSSEAANEPRPSSIVEERSVRDIDYEIEPTQRIAPSSNKDPSGPSNRVSLNDTIERNLGAMFEDMNEECVDEQDQISTQVLRDVLQSPKKLADVDSDSPTGSKSTRSNENENIDDDSQTTENYFCGLTSKRKMNVLANSQNFETSERTDDKIDKEGTAIDCKNMNECNTPKSMSKDAELVKSTPKTPTTPKSSRKNTPLSKSVTKEQTTPLSSKRKKQEPSGTVETISAEANVSKNDKNVPKDALDNKVFSSTSITGTLSNPGSPVSTTSSEYRININLNLEKQISVRIAPKKKRGRKPRVPVSLKSIENAESHNDNELGSSTLTESLSNSTASNLDVNEVSVNKEKRKTRKTPARKSKKKDSLPESKFVAPNEFLKKERQSSCIEVNRSISEPKSKASDFLAQSTTIATSIDSQKEARQVLSIKTNRKPRNSKKKDADVPSLLQVGKEVPAAKVAAGPAKENVLNDTCNMRTRKRNLSTVDTNESNFGKKLKTDTNEDEPNLTRGNRRNAGTSKRQSTTILNYVTRNDSPHLSSASSTPSDLDTDKQVMIKLKRVPVASPSSTTGSISPITRAELIPENDNTNNTKRQTRRATKANNQSSFNTSIIKDSNTTRNTRTRNANGTAKKEVKTTVEEISSEIGEESQEIEMIMSGVLKKPNPVSITESKKDTSINTKPINTRSKRKCGNISTDTDNTGNSSSSSIVYESDNAQFEVSISKPKRAKNSSVANTTLNVSPNRTRRSMSTLSKTKHRISFTGVSSNDYTKVMSKLGASQVEDTTKCTVLVTDKVRRTLKFLCALAQSVPIVSIDWLIDSGKANEYMDIENYILKDSVTEKQYKFSLVESLRKAKNHKLLEGYTIVLTSNVAPPPLPELKTIIITCGGKPLVRPPQSWPEKSIIVTREEDLANAQKFLARAPKFVTIHSIEFILTGILRQELNFSEFKLSS
ncbi:mediator of DNA damage checkpoint protein 1-like isoform X3 [Ceratina calcarata]|uniref:Mediator of DNA damage checkpoint protein 1 n=1 Tax=Ceratina calcarata TaxID=156304 RepID=A0AAJ7S435_9HYME|nr:mediator of DNA damage checkpoint protein 1-like isoform X3 [Ceratina calcarata]